MIVSTVMSTGTTPNVSTPNVSAQDHRFALLTARAGLEPELAQRYLNDPASVLAEFGLPAAETVYLAGEPAGAAQAVVREDLDTVDAAVTRGCYSNFTHIPGIPAAAADVR
ncbi:hypothetical protein [Streptomyces sp. NPDC052012]|uniref:hypothetical protein n=1 Tax=Streptomyces sp. NPDC052012 TaxID=3155051 RepID=UPI00344E8413